MKPGHDRAAEHLAAIVQSSDDAIVSKDLNGIVRSWNPAAERMFGYTPSEMIGHSITLIIPRDRIAEEDEVLSRIRAGEAVDHFETIRRRKDGTLFPVSLTISPIRDEHNVVVGASKIARDISERRRVEWMESERAELQRRLSALVGASGLLLASLELSNVVPAVLTVSQELIAADGYAVWRYDLEASEWRIGAAHNLSTTFVQAAANAGALAHPLEVAAPIPVTDVNNMPILDTRREAFAAEGIKSLLIVPLTVGHLQTGLLVLYYRQPHEFSFVEVQLASALGHLAANAIRTAELYDDVQEANRLKDEFLGTLSHELRTPLNAIMGYTRMLRSGLMQGDQLWRALDIIERNAGALNQIVGDVLDIARITSGKLHLAVEAVDLRHILDNAVATVMPAANAKGVRIEIGALEPAVVSGDPSRLQQVIWNLLTNGVKFTDRGGSVTVSVTRHDAIAELVVQDSGRGIVSEFLPHLFERFRQADGGFAREHGGLGLGLAICRQLLEMHGGTIAAESRGAGLGATFLVRLPLLVSGAVAEGEAGPAAARALPVTTDRAETAAWVTDALRGTTVLIVDDDADARSMLQVLLGRAGARVIAASSGLAALQVLEEREVPDLMLVDIGMPGMDGFDFMRRARRLDRLAKVPAAALTAYTRPEDRTRVLASGFQIHLAKPIDPTELLASLAALAGRVRSPIEHA
jgi:PAS domain S-box-containing protein